MCNRMHSFDGAILIVMATRCIVSRQAIDGCGEGKGKDVLFVLRAGDLSEGVIEVVPQGVAEER